MHWVRTADPRAVSGKASHMRQIGRLCLELFLKIAFASLCDL